MNVEEYAVPMMDKPLKIKKVMSGPSTFLSMMTGHMIVRLSTVIHRVKRQIPMPASIVVSAAYTQAMGPLEFSYINIKRRTMTTTRVVYP